MIFVGLCRFRVDSSAYNTVPTYCPAHLASKTVCSHSPPGPFTHQEKVHGGMQEEEQVNVVLKPALTGTVYWKPTPLGPPWEKWQNVGIWIQKPAGLFICYGASGWVPYTPQYIVELVQYSIVLVQYSICNNCNTYWYSLAANTPDWLWCPEDREFMAW